MTFILILITLIIHFNFIARTGDKKLKDTQIFISILFLGFLFFRVYIRREFEIENTTGRPIIIMSISTLALSFLLYIYYKFKPKITEYISKKITNTISQGIMLVTVELICFFIVSFFALMIVGCFFLTGLGFGM